MGMEGFTRTMKQQHQKNGLPLEQRNHDDQGREVLPFPKEVSLSFMYASKDHLPRPQAKSLGFCTTAVSGLSVLGVLAYHALRFVKLTSLLTELESTKHVKPIPFMASTEN
ncbi:hypothetical protein DFP73DRAFT_583411 [Morchella snyderi]|nr:hypothetical protein DFP73DRAFT_583411 [Morchella snyderi]